MSLVERLEMHDVKEKMIKLVEHELELDEIPENKVLPLKEIEEVSLLIADSSITAKKEQNDIMNKMNVDLVEAEEAVKIKIEKKKVAEYDDRVKMIINIIDNTDYDDVAVTHERVKFNGKTDFKLSRYLIPRWMYREGIENIELSTFFDGENYVDQFQRCLCIEEVYQEIEALRYNMEKVKLDVEQDSFKLDVPGLLEGRPSLVSGDRVLLKSIENGLKFNATISYVREKDIFFRCRKLTNKNIQQIEDIPFDVVFRPSRYIFRWLHFGIRQLMDKAYLKEVLFPKEKSKEELMNTECLNITEADKANTKVGILLGSCTKKDFNKRQLTAISKILNAKCRPAPYIIFGPPGTGKTRTLVEAILQVYTRMNESRILVCGNSNSCTDLLLKKIIESQIVPENEFIRLCTANVKRRFPQELEKFTKTIYELSEELVSSTRMIITTCCLSGHLNLFKGIQFDYVFIDEAGQVSEAENLLPIGLVKEDGLVVLAGDPYQLGPICLSSIVKKTQLSRSLLERLITDDAFQMYQPTAGPKSYRYKGELVYNENYITKLIDSYRCESLLLAVNNRLFYEDELVCKKSNQTPSMVTSALKVKSSLVFHEVRGREKKMSHSPSWWNPAELFTCISHVKRLYVRGLSPQKLGIITPYWLQKQQLKVWFERFQMPLCKIGTIEAFQGDEREVIIISTVRTCRGDPDEEDDTNSNRLQFLFQPKRFNVATSRAKWLNMVIGDPAILRLSNYWKEYMAEAEKHPGYKRKQKPQGDQPATPL